MHSSGRHSELTGEQRAEVMAALATIEACFENLVNLTPLERRTIPKMGTQSCAFVSKAVELTAENPQLIPAYVDANGMAMDFHYAVAIQEIEKHLDFLREKLSGTRLAAGSRAYTEALTVYHSFKAAVKSNAPEAVAQYEELASCFPRKVGSRMRRA